MENDESLLAERVRRMQFPKIKIIAKSHAKN
jgi:hypothetical protein